MARSAAAKKKAAPRSRPALERWIDKVTTRAIADRLGVSLQTVRNWRDGKPIKPDRFTVIKLAAATDGVVLTTDDLL